MFLWGAIEVSACNPQPNLSTPMVIETHLSPGTQTILSATSTLEQQLVTPVFTPTYDTKLFLPHCDKTPKSGLPSETSGGRYQDWYRYANESYGFSFAFPPDWDLIEGHNYVCVRLQSTPTVILIVGFKRNTEAISIQRTGVGAGDIITRGTVSFLGREIRRDILIYQGKDKAVLYNNANEIGIDSLVFTFSIDDFRIDYDTASLSKEVQTAADKIVESFELTSSLPQATATAMSTSSLIEGWLTYRNETYKYEFSYPPETTLQITSVDGFPGELPVGITFEDYLHQLQEKYGDLCVIATYSQGFLLIQAPNAWDYVLCGGFGVGADVVVEKSEVVSVNGKSYPARGWELYNQDGTEKFLYSEFFFVDLEDGTHIAFGGPGSADYAKFDDYLAVKEILLRMLASYRTIE